VIDVARALLEARLELLDDGVPVDALRLQCGVVLLDGLRQELEVLDVLPIASIGG
jgi:hypothetical protein